MVVLVVTAAVRVTAVPLATVPEESVRVVVVATPTAKLSGVDTVPMTKASEAKNMRENVRAPDFDACEQLLTLARCDDMLISVTTSDVTRSFQADGCALRRRVVGWWPLSTPALFSA